MPRPAFGDPAMLVASVAGVGYLPWAPGTWGSLVGVALAWLILPKYGPAALLSLCLILFVAGWWASERVARISGIADPGYVVIDEVVGQALTLAAAPPSLQWYAGGFVLFRLFDIVKPWPIRAVERRFRNGFGVMIDDIAAALYVMLIFYISFNIIWQHEGIH